MKSMRFKLMTGMMALVVIVLLLLWLFQVVFLESFYTSMHITNIKNEAYSIMNLLNDGSLEFENKAEAFAFDNNLSLELLDKTGNSFFAAGSMGNAGQMPMMKNNTRVDLIRDSLKGNEASATLNHPRFGNKFMLIALPVKAGDAVSGVLLLNVPLAPVKDTASIIKWQLFYITLILLVASLLISYLLARSFTRPLLKIKKATEVMASGDFSIRIRTKKEDEIGRLAQTINNLGEQLAKIEQLRKDLIANVSHELRTPLSLIRGYAETIRDVSGNNPEKRDRQLGIIIEETERLSSIVDDILNLSQMQSGYIHLNESRFMINETIEAIIRRYDVLSEKTGVKIASQCNENIAVEADETRIGQVLYNLINNAFNHTLAGGMIQVSAVDLDGKVRIEVSDSGNGIAEEDLPHIWDRFYKADKSGSKPAGTGLGLAIVKGVMEAHHAAYGVKSQQGVGTTFWFELGKESPY